MKVTTSPRVYTLELTEYEAQYLKRLMGSMTDLDFKTTLISSIDVPLKLTDQKVGRDLYKALDNASCP